MTKLAAKTEPKTPASIPISAVCQKLVLGLSRSYTTLMLSPAVTGCRLPSLKLEAP